MGRVGRLVMIVGFLLLWFVPVVGCLIMVAGAIGTAIASEARMLGAPPA
jgi:hypothetical protein